MIYSELIDSQGRNHSFNHSMDHITYSVGVIYYTDVDHSKWHTLKYGRTF